MRMFRFSLLSSLAFLALFGIALAAIRDPTPAWAGRIFVATFGALLVGTLQVAASNGGRRLGWSGFVVFGWGYLIWAAHSNALIIPKPPTNDVIERLFRFLSPPPSDPNRMLPPTQFALARSAWDEAGPFFQIAHCLTTLLAAILGAVVVRILAARATRVRVRDPTISSPD